MRKAAPLQRLRLRLEIPGAQQALHEPSHRTREPRLKRRGRPDGAGEMRQHTLVAEVRLRWRGRARDQRGLAPADRAERPAPAALGEIGIEQVAEVIDEQRSRARLAVVVGDVPTEHEQLLRP